MKDLLGRIDMDRVPRHVGIIMDGNGRWAKARGLARTEGHREGFEVSLTESVDGALACGLKWVTVYAFSTENWKRPVSEVRFLMQFSRELLFAKRQEFLDKGVRVRFIGRRDDRRIPRRLAAMADETEEVTAHCRKLNLTIALNYGGRAEVVDAVRALAVDVQEGKADPSKIKERDITRRMYSPQVPDADLVIRTSGEMRISNFLLWQAAYAELVFTPVLWPDFTRADLWEAIVEYQRRSRRFGGVD